MNLLITKLFKSAYRREPISSFIVIVGITDAVIGGVDEKISLFLTGLLIVILGVVVRRSQIRDYQAMAVAKTSRYRLPSGSSRQPLPLLVRKKYRR